MISYITDRDRKRSATLRTFKGTESFDTAVTKAQKQAQAITDSRKILGRFECFFKDHGHQIAYPLALKLLTLHSRDTKYREAFDFGFMHGELIKKGALNQSHVSDQAFEDQVLNCLFLTGVERGKQ